MSTENNSVEPVETNLDDFAAELFGQKEAAPVETNTESEEQVESESDATNEDTHADADDTSAPDNDGDPEEEDEVVEPPKPKKNRSQERIEELNTKYRETERKLNEALDRLAKVEAPEPTPQPKVKEYTGPKPTDLNEDGSEKYPLGEFDPGYLDDRQDYNLDIKFKAREAQLEADNKRRQQEQAQAELQTEWESKLVTAKERYPDLQEKGEQMVEAFEGIDDAYGNYLTNTIMDMEYGTDVLYYLASNIDEAKDIFNGGAKKATIALGRLEAKFAWADAEKTKALPKVSSAPPPPPTNRGSAISPPTIRGDEKDISLDDFERALFRKKT